MGAFRSAGTSTIGLPSGTDTLEGDVTHYRAIFDHSCEAILLTTPEGRVLAANDAAYRLFLREPGELTGADSALLGDPGDGRFAAVREIRQRRGRFAGVVTMRRSNGTPFEAEVTSTLFRDASGTMLAYTFLRDVTERERAGKSLLASEHRYRSLIETTGNVLIGITGGGMIMEWNREAERVFGLARREVLGKDYYTLVVEEGRRARMRADVAQVLAGERFRVREETITARDGTRRMVLWDVTRLLDVASRPLGVIVSGQDITERKHLEAQIQHTQKLESLGVLAGGIAHDFNNLLVGILGNASLARMDVDESSELHELLTDVETSALRAADLTKQLLAYSGRGRLEVRPVDLSGVVEEMAKLLQTVISKRAALHLDFARQLPQVEGDATQLRQIVMNLITNASDALNGGNGTITLRTGVVEADEAYLQSPYLDHAPDPGTYAYVEVTDSGTGMSAETMRKIFDPFFSTKFTGRGLGLAATLGIVRGHRGTIKLESALGAGTTFRVLLPVRHGAQDAVPAAEERETRVRGSGTVLVVDDDPTVSAVAKHMLERRGFRVALAADGAEGLALYARESASITLAFVDLTMPRMGGDELVRAIHQRDPSVPIVVMSGFSEAEVAGKLSQERIAAFVQKPFRVEEVDQVLRRILQAPGTGRP